MPVTNTINTFAIELGKLLSLLKDVLQGSAQAKSLINALGWELPPGVEDIGLAGIDLTEFLEKLRIVLESSEEEWEDEILMAARIADLAVAMGNFIEEIHHLARELPSQLAEFGDYVSRTNIHKELPRRIFDLLITGYLSDKSILTFSIIHLLNIIEFRYFEADEENFQVEHVRAMVHYDHVHSLFSDPYRHMQEAYGWGTPEFSHLDLLNRIGQVLQAMGAAVRMRPMDPRAEEALAGLPVTETETDSPSQLIINLYEEMGDIAGLKLGLSVFGVRPSSEGASDGGIGLVPIVRGHVEGAIPLYAFDDTVFEFSADADLLKRIALILRPNLPLQVRTARGLVDLADGRFAMGIRCGGAGGEPKTLVSFPGDSRLSMQQFTLMGGIEKFPGNSVESFLELGLWGCQVTFSLSEADDFLSDSISREQIDAPFDFRLGWTSSKGIYFHGSSGPDVSIPLHIDLGSFRLQSLYLALDTAAEGSEVEASISGNLTTGPLMVTVDRLGIDVKVSFTGGNLGLFGLSPRFKPPGGLGLAIDGGGFKGGGFLSFDPDNARYIGVLELEFQDRIDLKAIGLLTTKLPGGKKGFSLLIIITTEFTPIQLGLGFTLDGVGGLLGLNRTAKIERLRTGVRDNTLSSILFPTDIIANASRIISDLRQVFPPQEGRFIFGPMAKIAWGTPPLITIDLGLLIEVPDPVRLFILGVVKAVLPDEKAALLRLQVNFLGVINFEKKQLSFDASLYDSKLLSFPLSGDMAIRLNWGSDPNFLLTVGGFHPSFEPPPMNLPNLRRLTLQLLKGNNPRLTLETYFAVTSNTAQFGAKLELYAAKGRFNVYGFLSFDALFQFNPFYFIAEVSAMLALRVGSSSIASIKLDLTLEGTTPWKAHGTAKLKICWFLTVKVRFNKTFGEERDTTLPAIEVIPLLEAALSASGNWQPQIPGRSHLLVSLKQVEAAGDTIIAHPFGILEISQKVVPLNILIDKFGNQKPGDGNEFHIQGVTIGSQAQDTVDTEEFFAPAQFFEKTDLEKLSGKSFEKYDSGIRIVSSEKLNSDYYSKRDVEYELFYIDSQRGRLLIPWFDLVAPDADAFDAWAVNGAIADSDLSFAKNAKSALAPDEVVVGRENFAVVNTGNLTLFDENSMAKNEEAALLIMERLVQDNPALEVALQVVPQFEVNPL